MSEVQQSDQIPPEFLSARGNLIRTCRDMERILAGLAGSHDLVAEEIHGLRKLGKRLRGGLTVAGEAKPYIRRIAAIGCMLGGSRDAVVRAKTWESLGIDASTPASAEAAIRAMLAAEARAAASHPPAEMTDWSLVALAELRSRLEAREEEEVAGAAAAGVRQLGKRLKKRLQRAVKRVDDEDFHECRKVAKAWLGGIALAAPGLDLPGREEAGKLADHLGEENDLQVLASWLREKGFTRTTCPAAWKILQKRQEKIRRRSMALIRRELLPALGSGS